MEYIQFYIIGVVKMKGKVIIILIMMLLITSSFGIISIAKIEEIETNSESSIEIYVGDFDIYAEMGGYFYITISPYYNFNIDVGDEGAMITLYANYVMDCQHWMDDGYVEMSLVDTNETDSATTGEFETGTLEISHFFNPGESFVVQLYAKYTWWYGAMLKGQRTDYSFGSTAPVGPQYPEIELTPSSYDFGTVGLGECSEPQTFALENVGGETAEGIVYIEGNPDFIITMGGGEFSLESGQIQTIEVIFSPTSEHSMSAALIAFGYNCYSDSSYLTGIGEKDSVSSQKISNGYNLLKMFSNFQSFIR